MKIFQIEESQINAIREEKLAEKSEIFDRFCEEYGKKIKYDIYVSQRWDILLSSKEKKEMMDILLLIICSGKLSISLNGVRIEGGDDSPLYQVKFQDNENGIQKMSFFDGDIIKVSAEVLNRTEASRLTLLIDSFRKGILIVTEASILSAASKDFIYKMDKKGNMIALRDTSESMETFMEEDELFREICEKECSDESED